MTIAEDIGRQGGRAGGRAGGRMGGHGLACGCGDVTERFELSKLPRVHIDELPEPVPLQSRGDRWYAAVSHRGCTIDQLGLGPLSHSADVPITGNPGCASGASGVSGRYDADARFD